MGCQKRHPTFIGSEVIVEEKHVMRLVRTYTDDTCEFFCAACGRHLLLRWPPAYRREILDEGDPDVVHTAIVSPDDVQISLGSDIVDPWLEPFERWATDKGGKE